MELASQQSLVVLRGCWLVVDVNLHGQESGQGKDMLRLLVVGVLENIYSNASPNKMNKAHTAN